MSARVTVLTLRLVIEPRLRVAFAGTPDFDDATIGAIKELGGIAEINETGSTMDCVVRNFSESGACVELESAARIPE